MREELELDLLELLGLFGEPLPLSNPERGDYWFKYERPDGMTVTLDFSTVDRSVGVIVRPSSDVACASVVLAECDAIRVLEPHRKTLEVVTSAETHPRMRCFVALDADSILHVGPLEDE